MPFSEASTSTSTSQCDCMENQKAGVEVCKKCRSHSVYDWSWDASRLVTATVTLQNERRDVILSPGFSVGTVAVRGDTPLQKGSHHYWEIQMSAEVYGTDVMIGVGTDAVDLNRFSNRFVSLIGYDQCGWGLSYTGQIHHNGKSEKYCESFGLYAIIGVHLDMWAGTLEFFVNRKPLGIAFRGLQDKLLYPIISSTSARSGMNLIFSRSFSTSLQIQALLAMGKNIFLAQNTPLFKCLDLPPGLLVFLKNNFWWIMTKKSDGKVTQELPKSAKTVPVKAKRERKRPEKRDNSSANETEEEKYEAPMTRSRNKTKLSQEASADSDQSEPVKRLRRGRSETANASSSSSSSIPQAQSATASTSRPQRTSTSTSSNLSGENVVDWVYIPGRVSKRLNNLEKNL